MLERHQDWSLSILNDSAMGLSDITDPQAIERAIEEADRLGQQAFLETYGFRPARGYFVVHKGRRYDSKAIVGVAHRYQFPEHGPLTSDQFSGGHATVEKLLRRLGFDVDAGPGRNPDWTRDELILALDLYMTKPAAPPSQTSTEVMELSRILGRLAVILGLGPGERFRSANGVYMKMMNFRRWDPSFASAGKKGLSRGNKDEGVVWAEFATDRARLAATAASIRAALDLEDAALLAVGDDDGVEEAAEGRVLTRLHRIRERNRALVETRKARALAETGRLECEVCDFDFASRYGERGHGFMEAHHTRPVHTLLPGDKTRLTDLALVCANCHRMIHAKRPWLTVDQLKAALVSATGRRRDHATGSLE
jgi:5-methylcytosine-specific restriction protein A